MWERERTINMPISTEGSGMPTTRPKTEYGLGVGGRRDEWAIYNYEKSLKVRK